MTEFSQSVKQDTPRLVVQFKCNGDKESFAWGVVGNIPVLSLIGTITRVQSELFFRTPPESPELALVIAFDVVTRKLDWFCHPSIPVDSLCGMLETIKTTIIAQHMVAQVQAQARSSVLGPDGRPIIR